MPLRKQSLNTMGNKASESFRSTNHSNKRISRSKSVREGTNSAPSSVGRSQSASVGGSASVSSKSKSSKSSRSVISNSNLPATPSNVSAEINTKPRTRSISPHARAILRRTFSRSRSRSRSASASSHRFLEDDDDSSVSSSASSSSASSRGSRGSRSSRSSNRQGKQMLVAVTSCRSDAYYAQKAPGAVSMLPRKAPSALKTFHELAVGMKDAYEAVGATPVSMDSKSEEFLSMPRIEQEGKTVLSTFMENINFLLKLVDEVATDSATRGALKDDVAFKNIRDVIKKCNKVLEKMLVRRESKYTLFYRLVQPNDVKDIGKIHTWNLRVEKAVNTLSNSQNGQVDASTSDSESDVTSVSSSVSKTSKTSNASGSGIFRGRGASAGRTRSRRATPTPKLRHRFRRENGNPSTSADDGYATVTPGNVVKLQMNLDGDENSSILPQQFQKNKNVGQQPKVDIAPMAPKDELVGMIRDLRSEKSDENVVTKAEPADLKTNWMPKADVPGNVPKLPIEYIHRHRLMKQVVNSLINRPGADGSDKSVTHIITSITSRHADKAGNGKTTLAAAAIQSVEVRERFGDGIAWIQLGRQPLSDKDIRHLYEELYDQLLMRDSELNNISANKSSGDDLDQGKKESGDALTANALVRSRRTFQGSDLEGMKEALGRMLSKKNVLICLDDVWRVDDARRFIFDRHEEIPNANTSSRLIESCPYRILITTRTPGLMGGENSNEVFVRIFSEQEAVKLLVSSAGRRLYGGKSSPVFNEARVIVKGCGNSPLALRLAGGMLRNSNRNWVLTSQVWLTLVEQSKASLEEASKIRSFINSLGRVVDLTFMTVQDICLRASLRRSFVTFAIVFHNSDFYTTERGVPRGIVRKLFFNVISGMEFESNTDVVSPDTIIEMLERMNLVQRAGHDARASAPRVDNLTKPKSPTNVADDESSGDLSNAEENVICHKISYVMHESIKHIAADMATRQSPAFAPNADSFTAFRGELDAELARQEKLQNSKWFSNAAKFLFSSSSDQGNQTTTAAQFHELMVCALMTGNNIDNGDPRFLDDDNVERYIVAHLPNHLIRSQMFMKASELLLDRDFINRRVKALGCIEACKYQMFDLVGLRKDYHRSNKENIGDGTSTSNANAEESSAKSGESSGVLNTQIETIDAGKTVREGSRRIADAIRLVERNASPSGKTIELAVCLSTIGEGLLKGRQTKESIIRLEEALHMLRDLLGSYHVEVARALDSVAKAYIKTGDDVTSLSKLSEASRIYESCDAKQHYDSIANSQLMASLLVDNGNWEDAAMKYDEVILLKSRLYGEISVPVAKSMNDYAIVLAKHSRMSEALRQYETARSVFERLSSSTENNSDDNESAGVFAFDMTLIDLNIASIKSKLANYEGALESYERGVSGLRLHIKSEENGPEPFDPIRQAAQKRHLVSAIGRIGSLRMKLRDNAGALEAYLMLLAEVVKNSPLASQMEKAKAHVKCATIYRQMGSVDNNRRAVTHLKEAQMMYTEIHGVNHKDTRAISSSLKQWMKADKAS